MTQTFTIIKVVVSLIIVIMISCLVFAVAINHSCHLVFTAEMSCDNA